jgi:hypothetical protein
MSASEIIEKSSRFNIETLKLAFPQPELLRA